MKRYLPLVFLFTLVQMASGQITTPVIRAGFGVDADLRANFFNGFVQSGNDDWFNNGTAGTGNFIIDTSGAAAMMARYATDLNFRKLPFFRTMRYQPFSVVNNRLLIDALFTRDYHGDDSTIFAAGSNKNGMSPIDWSCPVSQSIPDKNDILDMMVHVRRAGPGFTDSLWMMGGVSIENTTGNRYFDFEMYQTDIFYDRTVRKFTGFGPDAGHTAWRFDAAGNVTQPGDIIFTAEYGSSSLTMVEARIWVDRASLSITPATFNWTGQFDGANNSSQYGYASIAPKTAGAFYTGLQSANNTWPGPFGAILGNNSMPATYIARQFMEFSVNLTKLGLDPVQLLGSSPCGMAFRKVLVKSRASTSFTAELKDFVGPFDFFATQKAQAAADIPLFCGMYGVSNLTVTNPVTSSIYEWSTADGNIISLPVGPSIYVDMPGNYVVTQRLLAGCPVYASDTVTIVFDPLCSLLDIDIRTFTVRRDNGKAMLDWSVADPGEVKYYDVERSLNGKTFAPVVRIAGPASNAIASAYADDISNLPGAPLYYRIKVVGVSGKAAYSKVVLLEPDASELSAVRLFPNPATDYATLHIQAPGNTMAEVRLYDGSGRLARNQRVTLVRGGNQVSLTALHKLPAGLYMVRVIMEQEVLHTQLLIRH